MQFQLLHGCCVFWLLCFQNEKCHLLIEHETQKLKSLDENHNQHMKEWRDKLRPRKKVRAPGCEQGVLAAWLEGQCPQLQNDLRHSSCVVLFAQGPGG